MKPVSATFLKSFPPPPGTLMRVWTFQEHKALDELKTHGQFHSCFQPDTGSDGSLDDPAWNRAHHWMHEQMSRLVPDFSGQYPVWAWPKRPNLRLCRRLWPRQSLWLIAADVPAQRILASDYDLWHIPLNGGRITKSAAEDADLDAAGAAATWGWEKVFDIGFLHPDPRVSRGRSQGYVADWIGGSSSVIVQLCVDGIRLPEVRSIRPLHEA